jgi:hypothetical protein
MGQIKTACYNCGTCGIGPWERRLRRLPSHLLVFCGLMAYSIGLAVAAGETGFQTDDWWVLSVPYWHSFPSSFWQYAVEFRRPLDGLIWVTLFPLFGFNKTLFNLFALTSLALACFMMGAALTRAFPQRRDFVAASMLLAFFLPTIAPLTYVLHMDNIWVCFILFWGSVRAFQHWAEMRNPPWKGLILPVSLYYLSTLAYDAANLWIFLAPLLVWPVRIRHREGTLDNTFLFRLGAGIVLGFAGLVLSRFVLFGGGAVGLRTLVPPLKLVESYFTVFPLYLEAPFRSLPLDPWTLGLGGMVLVMSAWLLYRTDGLLPDAQGNGLPRPGEGELILLWGITSIVLGVAPYLMAAYGASTGYHGRSRIYSSASFGVAILLGLLITGWRPPAVRYAAKTVAVAAIALMALFHADLRRDWQRAAEMNCSLWTSLTRQVPDVAAGTVFLFLDLQCYIGNRAIVFGGVNGLREFIRMFYHHRNIAAYYLYPQNDPSARSEPRLATVSASGIVARGVLPKEPIPLDRLLIVARKGDRLVLLKGLSAGDGIAAIRWSGVSSIRSNLSRILRAEQPPCLFSGICLRQAAHNRSTGEQPARTGRRPARRKPG